MSKTFALGEQSFDFWDKSCLYFDLELYKCDVLMAGKEQQACFKAWRKKALNCRSDCAAPRKGAKITEINPMKVKKNGDKVPMKSTYSDKDKPSIDFIVPKGLEYSIISTTNDNQVTELVSNAEATGASEKFTLKNKPNFEKYGWAELSVKAFSECGKSKTSNSAVVCDEPQPSTGLTTIKLRVRDDEDMVFIWDKHAPGTEARLSWWIKENEQGVPMNNISA